MSTSRATAEVYVSAPTAWYAWPPRASIARGLVLLVTGMVVGCATPSLPSRSAVATASNAAATQPAGPPIETSPTPSVADEQSIEGIYVVDSGTTYVASAQNWLLDLSSGAIRRLTARSADSYTTGPAFGIDTPIETRVEIRRGADGTPSSLMIESPVGTAPVAAERMPVERRDIRFESGGIQLAGTVSRPPRSSEPVPGIVILHGSGRRTRVDSSLMAGILLSRGVAVLQFDKRGVGQSGGAFLGDAAGESELEILAADAVAAVAALAAQPGIDPAHVGLFGASQAGWIIPIAAQTSSDVAFGVILAGPAVSVGEQNWFGDLSGDGTKATGMTDGEIAQAMPAHVGGFDPVPGLRKVQQPLLWLFGSSDRIVPTARSVEVLKTLTRDGRSNFDVVVVPDGDHGMLDNPSGLADGAARSSQMAVGFTDELTAWLSRVLEP